ncbi:MAG: S-layer protein, partial [Candidatus Micrarchaeota archaeon]|nr:S-layer protein [Candidatus Micrarchaeota archaeon]
MNSLNAKRITAIAASLAMGLVFAGPVSFSNIPIINSAGQPVVQIVLGSTSQPSDGVVAANIAAVIGNLAFTSTPITATVGNTGAVSCAVTTPSCTLTGQQVWLGEKGSVSAAGSYTIKALIGSVLNGAALNYGTLPSTKTLQGTSASNSGSYAYSEGPNTAMPAVTGSPT